MGYPNFLFFSAVGLIALFLQPVQIASATQRYCSSQNTGADSEALFHEWQTNGWCTDACKGSYAFGVVQGNYCWCSNYIPEDQTDVSKCNKPCPGYPDDKCGSDDGLFGYIALQRRPSGTLGAPRPTSTQESRRPAPTPSSSPSPAPTIPVPSPKETHQEPETVVQTVTEEAPVITLVPSEAPPADPTTTTQEKGPSATDTPTAPTSRSVQIITVSGQVTTVTIEPSASATGAPAAPQPKKKAPVGAIAGGVIGGALFLAAIIGAVFILLRRRRRQQDIETNEFGVQRHTSTMSRSGLIRSEKTPQYPPNIVTNVNRHSRMMDSESPGSGSDRRHSRPFIFDQRLNPSAIMTMDNVSRSSFVSLDDSRDYGRTLNVRNPDPDPDPDPPAK